MMKKKVGLKNQQRFIKLLFQKALYAIEYLAKNNLDYEKFFKFNI